MTNDRDRLTADEARIGLEIIREYDAVTRTMSSEKRRQDPRVRYLSTLLSELLGCDVDADVEEPPRQSGYGDAALAIAQAAEAASHAEPPDPLVVCGEDIDHDWVFKPGERYARCLRCDAVDGPLTHKGKRNVEAE